MALPEITVPAGAPIFLVAGHQIDEADQYASIPMGRGHSRKRRVTTPPSERVVDVAWILTTAQMAAVDDWFENTLKAGNEFFAAQVANQDAFGRLWWKAKWLEPYLSEPLHRGYWRVSGKLFLVGEGTLTPPVSTTLGTEITVPLLGSASIEVGKGLALEIVVPLVQRVTLGAVEFRGELLPGPTTRDRITVDGIARLTTSGATRTTTGA
jgi:hypothetical protein